MTTKKIVNKLILVVFLACLIMTSFAQKKVAVYVTGEDASINKVLSSKLISAIARSQQYTAIERTEAILAELNKELNYQQTGAVDDDELSRLGKQFGVQYVCVATVYPALGEQYISARLINVETAQVERSASSNGNIKSLDDIIAAANSLSLDLLSNLENEKRKSTKKVAVYIVPSDAGKDIEKVLGDKLVSGFTNSGRYVAIERTNSFLTQLNKEQDYQRKGSVDDQDISRLGKQFGVQYVCVADVTDVFGKKFITARLIDVETAEAVNTYEIGGLLRNMKECLKMTNEIATNLSKGTFAEQAEEAQIIATQKDAAKESQGKATNTAKESQDKAISTSKEATSNAENKGKKSSVNEIAISTFIPKTFPDGSKGIVFYMGENGHGLAISLDETYCRWQDKSKACYDITSLPNNDGAEECTYNQGSLYTTTIFNDLGVASPAVIWCTAHGDGWYLPSAGELWYALGIANNGDGDTGSLNKAIVAAGGSPIKHNWYWSSSEKNDKKAINVCFSGWMQPENKISEAGVRAVRAF